MKKFGNSEAEQVAERTVHDGGATFDTRELIYLEPDDYWYFPQYPGLTKIVSLDNLGQAVQEFVSAHVALFAQTNIYLGTWINPDTRMCYLDITTKVKDKAEALALAKEASEAQGRKIVTMYNPHRQTTEYVWDNVRK